MKSKKIRLWLIVVVLVLIGIRAAMPVVIKDQLNQFMGNFSEIYALHVADVDLSIIRGAYRIEGVKGTLKSSGKEFLDLDYVDFSVAWRDLIRGVVRADVFIDGLDFKLTQELLQVVGGNKDASKDEAQKLGDKVLPVRVSRVDIKNSALMISDVTGLPPELQVRITQIDGRLSNATPTPTEPVGLLKLKGVVQESATAYVVGEMDQSQVPAKWLVSFEARDFDLTALNPFLRRVIPVTFQKGSSDIYAEAKGEKGDVEGYVKPFLKDMRIVGDEGDFKNFKHLGIEVITAISKFLLNRNEDRTVATKVNFSYRAGKFDYKLSEVLAKAIEHGYRNEIPPGVENQYKLNP